MRRNQGVVKVATGLKGGPVPNQDVTPAVGEPARRRFRSQLIACWV
jgi:hypothetical protein